ncbi:hypothetical protein ACFV0T_15205 [Streptomyces sp. NPDC059582]|uniref:hypothetical protein n=1 Tax=Streptomyces sp. NPDC059582 TaxID=3346875 RepID=UPI0036932C09
MITASDDGPDLDPDDPLAVILRPTTEHLGPPPGRYEEIRRSATRRRLLRVAAGAGLTGAVAVLVALPFQLTTSETPVSPTVPLAPPPASSPSVVPSPTRSAEPVTPRPSASPSNPRPEVSRTTTPGTTTPGTADTRAVPTRARPATQLTSRPEP